MTLSELKKPDAPAMPTSSVRGVLSLVVTLHLLCVFLALAANYAPSQLQSRVLQILAPYTDGLNLNPDGTAYYMTHGDYLDVDWRLEWLPETGDESDENAWKLALPATSNRVGWNPHREQRLLREWAALLSDEESPAAESQAAELARSLAQYLRLNLALPAQALRLRRHTLQPPEAVSSPDAADRDPESELYFDVVYHADIIVDGDRIEILRRTSAAEEAGIRGATP